MTSIGNYQDPLCIQSIEELQTGHLKSGGFKRIRVRVVRHEKKLPGPPGISRAMTAKKKNHAVILARQQQIIMDISLYISESCLIVDQQFDIDMLKKLCLVFQEFCKIFSVHVRYIKRRDAGVFVFHYPHYKRIQISLSELGAC